MNKIIDLQLFPSVDYIKEFAKSENILISSCEWMQKRTFRNRYIVSGANGLIALTIPIVGGREKKQLYKDVKIDFSENWQDRHWKTLQSAYNKSPYFEYYSYDLHSFFTQKEEYLFSFNYKILVWLLKVLKINCLVEVNEDFYDNSKDYINLSNKFLPNTVISQEQNWKPKYPQVFEDRFGFLPNLSILDMLFCVGPDTYNLLKNNC